MFSFLNNIPVVTRNLLIINVLLYAISYYLLKTDTINLFHLFSSHYIGTPLFEPFQIVTHMFMHGDIMHLFFNMFGIVIFGSFLEHRFGHKRFFIFYFLCGIGAFVIENVIYGWQVYEIKQQIVSMGYNMETLNNYIIESLNGNNHLLESIDPENLPNNYYGARYVDLSTVSGLGASGALFGLLGAFVILFPNTELMLLFIPFPVKAKYLIGFYILYEAYRYFNPTPGDHINHLAHLSGAVIGIVYVLINRRIDRQHFF